jgi:hypothetical protein
MTLTLGMIAAQKRSGPYTLTYAGRANSSGSVTSLSGSFNLGAEYRDRLVFIGITRSSPASVQTTSVTVGGKSGTRIGGNNTTGLTEWWYVASDAGTTSVSIQANFPDSYNSCFVVYVLGGGALGGTTPTTETINGYTNNSNNTYVYPSAANNNDIFMALALKANGGSSSVGNFISNMSPLTNNAVGQGVGTDNDGSGSCQIGPITATVSPYIRATGFDSTKPLQVCAIRIRKAT